MNHKDSGLSALEALVTVLIAAILSAATVPGIQTALYQSHFRTALYQLVRTVNHARALAVNEGKTITLCVRGATLSCQDNWHENMDMLLFHDENKNYAVDENEPVYFSQQWSFSGLSGKLNSLGRSALVYFPNGSTIAGNISLCAHGDHPELNRAIIFNTIGRPRLSDDTDNDGIEETGSHKPIVCD